MKDDVGKTGRRLPESARCLERADEYLQAWECEADPSTVVHAALELRMGLELYLLERYEAVAGERPPVEGRDPIEVLDEALQLHDEANSPQRWGLVIEDDIKENPARALAERGAPRLTVRKAQAFYTELTELLHGTVYYLPRAEQRMFWEKQAAALMQIKSALTEICRGQARPDTAGPVR